MAEQRTPTELGTEPVGKLLLRYAIPAIIAQTATSLYNMVDSIFIGQGVGAMAISGLGITFPLMNLSGAFGAAIGVGGATMISVKLGQRDYKVAENVLGNVVSLNIIIGILLGLTCLVFMDPILYFFGASENTLPYARDYMQIIMLGNVISHSYFGLNAVLRAAGKPKQAMGATLFTVALNTLMDPLFIYTFNMGVRGAALATILAQMVALMYQMKMLTNKEELLHLKKGIYRIKTRILKGILSIGMSPFLMNICACLVVIIINNVLVSYGGDYSIGAYSIINRVMFIFIMLVIGFNQGMQPIAGYNFGARQYGRVTQVLKHTIAYATIITTLGFVIGVFFPAQCTRIFTSDAELIAIANHAMPIMVMFFPIVGFQMATTNFFQSIGMAKKSVFLSLTRQLIYLLPGILVLPPLIGLDGVWWAMAASDVAAAITTAVMLYLQMKKFHKMQEQDNTVILKSEI